jgi:hypothetical protein
MGARAQQPPDSLRRDTAIAKDTLHKDTAGITAKADSIDRVADSLHRVGDSLKNTGFTLAGGDSLLYQADRLHRVADSLRKVAAGQARPVDTLLSATALLRQVNAQNAGATGSVDSVRLKLDAMLNAATVNQRPATSPGIPGAMQHQEGNANPSGPPQFHSQPGSAPPGVRRPVKPPALSNLHRKYVPVRAGRVQLDSVSVVPTSFLIRDVPDSAWSLDWVNGALIWNHPPAGMDSVLVIYRSFPYKLNAVAKRWNYDSVMNYFLVRPYDKNKDGDADADNFFNFGNNMTYNGSFGRSITFGNSQDAVVTSNLNLQISGYLADSIQITAAITDNNIPIQPDGTTANLNEFDQIFLQFKKRNWALTMGDIDLRQNQLYFLNFYKRLEGASFETSEQLSPAVSNKTLVSAAIAKGKFTRNIFQGQEGNQGPYKLQDANNDLYFIVLAGTERVFIDGQQMQRGEDQDYTINYNTAEVTFTPNRMIGQDARIQVEFEYADRNYLNSNLYLYDEADIDHKLKVKLGVFSNSDARNDPINQTLTPQQTAFLAGLGDSIQHAFYPVAVVDTLGPGKILYQKVDTFYKNAAGALVYDSIYEFSVNPSVTLYNLSFVNVGQGYGNYVPDLNGVNGSVYMWVAPINGVMQGSYEAAQYLVTPKTQQVVSLGADYALDKHTMLTTELAHSHYDINTLSTIEKNNDNGNAAKLTFKDVRPVGPNGMQLTSTAGYEYVQAYFTPLERLRAPEFYRDWGMSLTPAPADEKLYNASMMLMDKKLNSIKYEIDRYERNDGFIADRNTITNRMTLLGWNINDKVSLTTSDSSQTVGGYYLRPSVDISRKLSFLGNYVVGGAYSLEKNEDKDEKADTLTSTSYAFHTWTAYLKSPEKAPNKWGMSFTTRTNSYPNADGLTIGDRSKTFNVFADLLKNPHEQLHVNVTYRVMEIADSSLETRVGTIDSTTIAQGGDKTLLGRVEYVVNEWKGLLRGNALYEIGSGQQQELSFTYLQVPAGTGQYAWIDYNHDGIQQLNEFVLAQFPDQAQYIRVYTPTGDYIKANYNTFNFGLSINPKAVIKPKSKGVAGILARAMLQSSLQLNEKEQAHGLIEYNPFTAPLNDTSLITRTMILVNTFSFNKTDPRWGFDLSNTHNGGKTLLTYGYQLQQTNEWSVRTRLNLSKSIAFTGVFRQGTTEMINSSSNFDSSNYNLKQFTVQPGLTYTRRSNLRIGLSCSLSQKQNSEEWGGQKYSSDALNTDFKYNILQSTSIQGKFTVTSIMYTGPQGAASTTSPVSYTILEGLNPGTNFLWGIDFTKKLGSSLELSIQYEGRKPADAGIVHTGRAALRAIL